MNNTNVLSTFKKHVKFAIIGAGIAGLAAARTLELANIKDYVLIEAQSQLGGRISSVPWNDNWVEAGAQFFHGDNSSLAMMSRERNLLSDIISAEGEGIYLREDGSRVNRSLIMEIDDVVTNILSDCEIYSQDEKIDYTDIEENIDKVLRKNFDAYMTLDKSPIHLKNLKKEIFDWFIRFLVIDNSCKDLKELSVKSWGNYKIVNGPDHNVFKTHYGSIIESIAGELTHSNIITNCPVVKIKWNNFLNENESKSILIVLENGQNWTADCVLVTCSLGVLKATHQKLFSPNLPSTYINAIECIGFGLINKIFIEFEEPWWESEVDGFQFLWSLDDKDNENKFSDLKLASWTRDITGFDVLKNHKATLLGWVGGKGAELIETLSLDSISKDSIELLKYFLKKDNIPEPKKCLRTCWGQNPFVRGAYSHISKKCNINSVYPGTLSKPVWKEIWENEEIKRVPILMFAGEGTHDYFYSTTHGAYDTGVEQAKMIIKYHVN